MTDVELALVIQNATTELGDSLDYFSRLITFPDIYLPIESTPSVEKLSSTMKDNTVFGDMFQKPALPSLHREPIQLANTS